MGTPHKSKGFSELFSKVTSSCFLQPLAQRHLEDDEDAIAEFADIDNEHVMIEYDSVDVKPMEEVSYKEDENAKIKYLETSILKMFQGFSSMKQAYIDLQSAHSPYDIEKLKKADKAVCSEFRKISELKTAFRKKYKLDATFNERHTQPGRSETLLCPNSRMFESAMHEVVHSGKCFTRMVVSLMKDSRWNLESVAKSIASEVDFIDLSDTKYALESYVCQRMFQGFENDSFCMKFGHLCHDSDPGRRRKECFNQFQDFKTMDPVELLRVAPDSPFGAFCNHKYLRVIHAKMEESFFGNFEQRCRVVNGEHPETWFYEMFVRFAKAVWVLHKLAFSMEPMPGHFYVKKGCLFQPKYMENVVSVPEAEQDKELSVGFPLSPGFKVGGVVIKARVYAVPLDRCRP